MFSKSSQPDSRLSRYDYLIVHVTATPPNQDLDDIDIDRMHRARRFNGCGYNALIKRDGTWLDSDMGALTRPIGKSGAHVGNCGPGWNKRSFGISLVGGVDASNRPQHNATSRQMDTLAKGLRRFLELYPGDPDSVIVMGHRDLIRRTSGSAKACPCFDIIPWWQEHSKTVSAPEEISRGGEPSLVDRPPFWTVASGDTLSEIAQVTGVSIDEMKELNPEIYNLDLIAVGQIIRLT